MTFRYSVLILLLAAGSSPAQTAAQNETQLGAEFRLENGRFKASCLGKTPDGPTADSMAPDSARGRSFPGCAELLFTDHPLHIAVGSIAPQNRFGTGLALVIDQGHVKWDVDAVASTNGSWRAGAYLKIIPSRHGGIKVNIKPSVQENGQPDSRTKTEKPHVSNLTVSPSTIFTLYAQGISLNKLGFFGLGENNSTAGRSFFGMTQAIVGGNAIVPVAWAKRLNLSALGEINGRFVDIRSANGQPSPSIEALYTPVTAPGLATQPAFLQFGEGLRAMPTFEYLQFNYLVNFQQFVAPGDSTFSFRRLNIDLSHVIPLYHSTKDTAHKPSGPDAMRLQKVDLTSPNIQKSNGPDECGSEGTQMCLTTIHSTVCDVEDNNHQCKEVRSAVSRNREGSLGFRFLLTESATSGSSVVPFYFQPTLGGSDVNGNPSLSSYQDYRFRAPNILLLRESLDHSIYGPIGMTLMADEGKAALTRGDIDFQHLRHSFAAGLNIRAGGLPAVQLLFAWGGREGSHFMGSVNTSLLPGSPRPSLF